MSIDTIARIKIYSYYFSFIALILFSFIIIKLFNLYWLYKHLPPGPVPLLLLGNLLLLKNKSKHAVESLVDVCNEYGPGFTFWCGPKPIVFIADIDLAKEAFKNKIVGKPKIFLLTDLFSNDEYSDIAFADYGRRWKVLRRVAHAALRNYSVYDKLPHLVREIVEDNVKSLKDKTGVGKINPQDYINFMFINILYASVLGLRLDSIDDPEFKRFNKVGNFFLKIIHIFAAVEFLPFLRFIFKKKCDQLKIAFKKETDVLFEKFQANKSNYQPGVVNSFSDALTAHRDEAIAEGKENAAYLTDKNLAMTISDFIAGADTSQTTCKWMLLLLATYPELQKELRNEVALKIGDRMPVEGDRNECHYVMAFITETMRFRNIFPFGSIHTSQFDTRVGDYLIPKNTCVFVFQQYTSWDSKYFTDPDKFRPDRFLDENGIYKKPSSGFIPFGIGLRACPGEKLTWISLFLVLVNLLQFTSGYQIALPGGPGSVELSPEPTRKGPFLLIPRQYEIVFKKDNFV